MIDRQSLQALYSYNGYANRLLLDTLSRLGDAEYTEVHSPNYTSIRKLATHSFTVERFFLAQCREKWPKDVPHQPLRNSKSCTGSRETVTFSVERDSRANAAGSQRSAPRP